MRAVLFAITFASVLAILVASQSMPLSGRADSRPNALAGPDNPRTGDIIPGRYIVVLREGRDAASYATLLGRRHGFTADLVFRRALRGFAADISDGAANALRDDPNVLLVEPDRLVTASPQDLPTGIDRIDADENPTAAIDGVDSELDVDIAVIDTGVDVDHPDLNVAGGYASYALIAGPWAFCGVYSDSWDDDNGHGTHVAGTAAARDNGQGVVGVAPGARIWAVKALTSSGSGCLSDVIAGVDWVTANADTIEVANMSLEGASSTALCDGIANSVAAGVTYSVAAGNSATDAQNSSPANCPDAIAVSGIADFDGQGGGATDQTVTFSTCSEDEDDSFACFSNFGSVVDIAAPGVNILSTYPGGGYATFSGTSMASPHVAGAAGLQKIENPGVTPAQVRDAVIAAAIPQSDPDCGFTGDPDGYPEPLLNLGSRCSGGTTPTPTPTPMPDADGDGVPDTIDNCPAWYNPDQNMPPWPVPEDDHDCDGFTTTTELSIGTDPLKACPITATPDDEDPDAWPPDFDDNQTVNILDFVKLTPPVFNTSPPDPNYSTRKDLNGDSAINILDIVRLTPPVFNQSCAP